MRFLQETPEGISFYVHVQPGSSKNEIVGRHGDALKIKLTAPPVAGAANKLCLAYLSKRLGISKSSLEIRSGHTGRTKRILIRHTGRPSAAGREKLKERIEHLAGS
jgi:uncharacterized protein (TIGR00251 family)